MFSEELIKKAKDYFSKRFQREISDEEANQYLNSLADLFLIFARAYQNHGIDK